MPCELAMAVVVDSYLETLLWSSTGEDGERLEGYEVSPKAREEAWEDCNGFIEYAEDQLGDDAWDGLTDEQVGHNFALSRNVHGAGFFDSNAKYADKLQALAETFGSVDCYYDADADWVTFN